MKCLKCKSPRVATGRLEGFEGGHVAVVFRPEGLRLLSFTLAGGTDVSAQGYACLECGLVWSSTDATKLAEFIKKHCNPPIDPESA